jgi:hypothetical protein
VPGVVFLMQKILLKTKIIKNSIYGKWRTLKFSHLSWIFPMFFLFRNTIPTIRNFNNFNEKFKSHITDSKKFKEYFIDKKYNEVKNEEKNEEKKEVRLKFVFHGSGPQSLCLFRHFFGLPCNRNKIVKIFNEDRSCHKSYSEEEKDNADGEYVYWGGPKSVWGDICPSVQKSSGEDFAKKLSEKLNKDESISQIDLIGHSNGGRVIVYALNYLMTEELGDGKFLIDKLIEKKIKINLVLCATPLSDKNSQMLINFLKNYENSKLIYTHSPSDIIASYDPTNVTKFSEIGSPVGTYNLYNQKNFDEIKDKITSFMFWQKKDGFYSGGGRARHGYNEDTFTKEIYPYLSKIEDNWDLFKGKNISFLLN